MSNDYKIGDTVKCISRGGYSLLKHGEIVTVINIEPGMFDGDFYTTVRTAHGKKVSGFDWRFEKVQEQR